MSLFTNFQTDSIARNAADEVKRQPKNDQFCRTGVPKLLQQFAATIGIIILSPVFLLTALLVRLESPGAVFYSQIRVGEHGRRFRIFKFRSMRTPQDPKYIDVSQIESDREGACKKLFNDPRITRVGKVIRKYSIDELPQLLNVVIGDMVLIGPRPALPCETDQYSLKAHGRLQATPGLTGLWQVSGRADTSFEEQIALDLRYVEEQSVWQDIRILFATIPVVLFGRGAY